MVDGISLTGYYQMILKQKYNGSTLADEMMEKMNDGLFNSLKGQSKFNLDFNLCEIN